MATDRFNGVVASLAIKVRCVLGAEANVVLNGTGLIEGIAVADGDRVLLTAQTDPIENGVWNAVSNGPWTRAADWDGNRDIEKGSTVWAGSAGQDDKLWQVQTDGIIQPGTTAVSITELFNPAAPTAASLADVTGVGNDTLGNSIIISSTNPALTFKDTNNTIGTATGSMIFTDSVDAEIGSVRAITSNVVVESVNGLVILQADNGYAISSHFIAGDPGTESTGINVGGTTYQSALKVSDIGGSNLAQMILHRHSTTIGPVIVGSRSNTDDSSHGLVTDGQALLWLIGCGWDGAAYQRAGEIQIDVDGTAAASDMPGRIILATTPSGAIVPVERLRISSEGGVYLNEMSAADTDIAGRGQFWVRDDTPNLPMFTDDTGVDYELNAVPTINPRNADRWNFETSLTTPPATNGMQFNSATPSAVTVVYFDDTALSGLDAGPLISKPGANSGWLMTLYDPTDFTSLITFRITGTISDNVGWWGVTVTWEEGSVLPTNGEPYTIVWQEPVLPAGASGIGGNSTIRWDGTNDQWVDTAAQFQIDSSVVGTTRLTTNDGVFHIDGNSQIRMTAGTTYVAYTNNNSFVGFAGSYMHTGLLGGDLLGDFGNGNNDLRLVNGTGLLIGEKASAHADLAAHGQFWVRNDTPNLPMFTDDTGVDYILNDAGGGGSTGSGVWTTITPSGTDTDPGAGNMKLSTGNPASITVLYVSETDADGNDLSNLFNTVNDTDGYFIMRVFDATTSQYRVYSITSMVDNTTYWRLNLDYMRGNGDTSITNGTEVTLEFHTEAWVEAGVEASSLSDILYWEGATNRWEASGSQLRVNPASPPGGGRLYLGSTSGAALGSPYLYFDVGSVSAYLWQAHNSASSGFDFYERVEYGAIFEHQFGFATAGTPVKTAHFDGSNRFVIDSTGAFFIQEKGAAATDVAGLGQIWVRNDTPNVLMFTDDAGTDWVLNATAAAAGLITTDIITASPPTTEAVTGLYTIRDLDETDLLAQFGFEGSSSLGIINRMHGGPVIISGEDNAGSLRQIMNGDPDGSAFLYYQGVGKLGTIAAGAALFANGLAADPPTTETLVGVIQILDSDFTTQLGEIGFNAGPGMVIRNNYHGGDVSLNGENTAGTAVNMFVGDPDAGATMYHAGVGRVQTTSSGMAVYSATSTDTEDRYISFRYASGTQRGQVGYRAAGSSLFISNQVHGALVRITGEDIGGTERNILNADPDGAATIYYAGSAKIDTTTTGVSVTGQIDVSTSIFIAEQAAALGDVAGQGQLWVENTTSPANRLGFTDDAGNDGFFGAFAIELRESASRPYGATGAGGGMIYVHDFVPSTPVWVNDGDGSAKLVDYSNTFDMEFSTSTTAADPGNGLMKYNSATPASVTAIYFDQLDVYIGDQAHNILALVRGDILEIMSHGTPSKFHRFRVNGTVTDNTGWYTVPVTPMSSGSLHAANEIISVTVHKGPALLQNYAIEAPTEYVPTGTTQTLDYRDGPAFEVDLESVTANPTITLSNFPSTGYGQMVVKVRQDSVSSRTITWAGGTFVNAGGTAHTMNPSVDAISIFTFESWDGGTTIYAAGADYS